MTFYLYRSTHTIRAAKITEVSVTKLQIRYEGNDIPLDVSRRWLIKYDPSPGDYLVLGSNGEYSVEYGDITKLYEKIESAGTHVAIDDPAVGAVFAPQDVLKLEDAEALRRSFPLTYDIRAFTPEQAELLKESALNQHLDTEDQ